MSILTILLIVFLFLMDIEDNKYWSHALWIPFLWCLFPYWDKLAYWLRIGSLPDEASSINLMEGNPLNRAFYIIIIILSIFVLKSRMEKLKEILYANRLILLYFILGILSIFWSDYPFVTLKRLIRSLSTVFIVLIILTGDKPYSALGLLLKRLAFITIPISILFIKYIPDLGRSYHMGMPMYEGISSQKNGLGMLCVIMGIYFFWSLISAEKQLFRIKRNLLSLIVIIMIFYLLVMANSATSMVSLTVAVLLILISKLDMLKRNKITFIPFIIILFVFIGLFELIFNVKNDIISLLGRDPDLTNRVPIWFFLLNLVKNPLLGTGYESFWIGTRLEMIQNRFGSLLLQAHSGYVEVYLNLGIAGLVFLSIWIISGIKNIQKSSRDDYTLSVFRLCYFIAILLINLTEATLYSTTLPFMLFLLCIFDTRKSEKNRQIL